MLYVICMNIGFRIGLILLLLPLGVSAQENVTIGVIAPLTLGQADRGQQISRTAELVAKRRSSEKYTYSIAAQDGACGVGAASASAARQLLSTGAGKFVVTGCSGETLQSAPIITGAKGLVMAVFAAAPAVRELGDLVFRTFPDQRKGIDLLINALGTSSKIALLSEENAAPQATRKLLEPKLEGRLLFNEGFAPEEKDFRTFIARLRAKGAEAFIINSASPQSLAAAINQLKEAQLNIPVFCTYPHGEDATFLKLVGKNGDGLRYIGVASPSDSPAAYEGFLAEYERSFGARPHTDFLARLTYDGVSSIIDGIEASGTDPEKVAKFLSNKYLLHGATGKLTFDEAGDAINTSWALMEIRQGRPAILDIK